MKRVNSNSIAVKAVRIVSLTPALLAILSAFILVSAASAAELVVNGGFEEPVVPVAESSGFGWATYYAENFDGPADCPVKSPNCNDGTLIPGWSVFWTDDILIDQQFNPGRLEIQSGYIWSETLGKYDVDPAYNGSLQKAELDSHHRLNSDNNNVTISQLLPTCPLMAYTLNYAWKSRTEIPGDNDVRVVIDGERVRMHAQNMAWEEEIVHFLSGDADGTLLTFLSVGKRTTTGMYLDEVSVIGPDGRDAANCSLVCDNKPMEITLRYDGDDISNHHQAGNEVIIEPEIVPSFPANARIKVFGHQKKKSEALGEFEVKMGGFFSVKGSKRRIPARLTFEIYPAEGGDLVQTVTFHSSCSQPLDAGDEFGAITVWSAVTEVNKITPSNSVY